MIALMLFLIVIAIVFPAVIRFLIGLTLLVVGVAVLATMFGGAPQ